MSNYFDAEQVYDEQLFPLVKQLLEICEKNDLPIFVCALYGRDETGEHFCSSMIPGRDRLPKTFVNFRLELGV